MAKSKLDWFKLDCQLDDKVSLIEAEFGLVGFAVVVKLWQKIYGVEGYYCEWNDDVALVFSRKIGTGVNVVSEIVARCIKRGIFDEEMFSKSGILTSHGIQQRYYECVERRKGEKIKPEYLLLCNTRKKKDADISSKNVDISDKNANISSTEENRREENRRDKKRQTEREAPPVLTPEERAELEKLSDGLSVESYLSKLMAWQQRTGKAVSSPYLTIRKWIEEDKEKAKQQKQLKSESSYDIEEWEKYAMRFDPNKKGQDQ